jgi:hypothetical protein
MRLTDEHIAKYQKIYLDTFGVSVSKDDALVQGLALLRLVKVLIQPMSNETPNTESCSTDTEESV